MPSPHHNSTAARASCDWPRRRRASCCPCHCRPVSIRSSSPACSTWRSRKTSATPATCRRGSSDAPKPAALALSRAALRGQRCNAPRRSQRSWRGSRRRYAPAARSTRAPAVSAGTVVAELAGPTGAMLAAERTLLNFVQRLSGIATLTARFVAAAAGTPAGIFDTRKTLPGWRDLDKYAVRIGGGCNHRHGLYDAVLLKDNHLAGVPAGRIGLVVFELLGGLATLPRRPDFVEVEIDAPESLPELLKVVGVDVILLDNFTRAQLADAVALRDRLGLKGRVALEASGGVTLAEVADVARTGIDRIAIGALTHSAPALDIGLDAVSPAR
ncbi:MAG: carboxylating nicotinate-nucleotide diphosphorylase [Phycisphaerae bacterium]